MSSIASEQIESYKEKVQPKAVSVLSGAVNLSSSQIVRRGFRSVFLLLAARTLGPEPFGFYVLLFTINEILLLISGSGFGDYITREVSKFPSMAREYLVRIARQHFVYCLIAISGLILILLALRYSSSALMSAVLLSLTLFPRGLVESCQGVIRSMHRFRLVFWIELTQGSTLLGVGSFLILHGDGIRGLIWAELASVLAGVAVALPNCLKLATGRQSLPFSPWKLIRETFVFNLYPLISNTYDRVDVIILARMVGNTVVGTYGLGYKGYAALSVLPYGIMGSLLPSLAKSNWNKNDIEKCRLTMQRLYAAALLLILTAMLLADQAVRLVLGGGYFATATTVKILVWATAPMFLNYALNTILLARKRERVFLWTASVCTVTNVTANLILIPHYSYVAAAAVTILTELVLLGLNLGLLRKSLGYLLFPKDTLQTTSFFAVVFAGGDALTRVLSPLSVAFLTIPIFAIYLYVAGVVPLPWRERTVLAG